MPRIPGINHLRAVAALERANFRIVRQGKHIVMSDGTRIVTIPRHNPVNAHTMGGIAKDAGLTPAFLLPRDVPLTVDSSSLLVAAVALPAFLLD